MRERLGGGGRGGGDGVTVAWVEEINQQETITHFQVLCLASVSSFPFPSLCTGNTNLIYSVIRSKVVFYQLANLPEDSYLLLSPRDESPAPLSYSDSGDATARSKGKNVCGDVGSRLKAI